MRTFILGGMWGMACASALLTFSIRADAWAYESETVTNGATVQGTITFTGTVPAPKTFEMRRYYDREYCAVLSDGKGHRLLKEVTVGADGGLKDV
ncbi:MAG TPA: hypothetical protein VFX56_01715, partial [Nitrospira sp.]|nr:hypothetical protein [Nitrospira sp.]